MTTEPTPGGEQTAQALVERLECILAQYRTDSTAAEQKQGIAHLFRRWVSYNATSVEPIHQRFMGDVEDTVAQLAVALALEGPELAPPLAAQAVALLTPPPVAGTRHEGDWYLMVAEYQCAALYPFLAREELRRRRDEMLLRTPRRLMFPKQLELLSSAEALLGDS